MCKEVGRYWQVGPMGKLEGNSDQLESFELLSCRHTSVMQHAEIRFQDFENMDLEHNINAVNLYLFSN